jgi:GntR family transcriptional regulator
MELSMDRLSDRPALTAADAADRFAVPKPLYSQVRDMLAGQIAAGQWSPGSTLPNETALSQTFGVSIGTIRRAVEGLEDMGIVVRRQGRGTFIAGLGQPSMADKLRRLRGPDGKIISPVFKVLGMSVRLPTQDDLRLFKRPLGSEVIALRRAILVGSRTVGVETSVLTDINAAAISTNGQQIRDVYAILAESGQMVIRAEEAICARAASPEEGEALSVARGTVVLEVERRAFAFGDRLVEVRRSLYLPSEVSYDAGAL